MQVENQGSRLLMSSNRTGGDHDGRKKDKRYLRLANSEKS